MRVAIAGAGVAGSTLHRVLSRAGVACDLFDKQWRVACATRPCGWGTSEEGLRLINSLGIPSERVLLSSYQSLTIDGRPLRASIHSIDKPKLLEALRDGTLPYYRTIPYHEYSLVVDATGLTRAYIGRARGDKVALNIQRRMALEDPRPLFQSIRGGYLWVIPLDQGEAHVGVGSTLLKGSELVEILERFVSGLQGVTRCRCSQHIRLSGPLYPVADGMVVAVGEAAGLVLPLGGAGIEPALESALALAQLIIYDRVDQWEGLVRQRWGWLTRQRQALDHLETRHRLRLRDMPVLWRALRYMGARPSLGDMLHLKRSISRSFDV